MFTLLKPWWDTIQQRVTPCRYMESDAQFFIDQISLRMKNTQCFYTKMWWNDLDITLHAMTQDNRVGEWSTLLFNRMQWDPTDLFRSLIVNHMCQKEHRCCLLDQDMEIYEYTEHSLWQLVFHAMISGDYIYNLPGNDTLWGSAWVHSDEWRNQVYVETAIGVAVELLSLNEQNQEYIDIKIEDIVGPLLLKIYNDAHIIYALNSLICNPENTLMEKELYRIISMNRFDGIELRKKVEFANTLVRWHDACCKKGNILFSSHENSSSIAYLLHRFFKNEWLYLDTCSTLDIPLLNRPAMLYHYFKDPQIRSFELPQIEA